MPIRHNPHPVRVQVNVRAREHKLSAQPCGVAASSESWMDCCLSRQDMEIPVPNEIPVKPEELLEMPGLQLCEIIAAQPVLKRGLKYSAQLQGAGQSRSAVSYAKGS
jgi:hypothetical protein